MITPNITPCLNTTTTTNNINTSFKARRFPKSIVIDGYAPGNKGRIVIVADDAKIQFPSNTTLKDLIKSLDMMWNTYIGKNNSSITTKNLRMYG